MRIVAVRWGLLPFFQFFRWTLVILLWLATLTVFTLGLSSLARIFTGDAEYGALDGVQFTEALYQAVFRFIVVAVLVLLLQRLLRWRPGRWLKSWLERAEAARQERRDRDAADAVVAATNEGGTDDGAESDPDVDGADPMSGTGGHREGHDPGIELDEPGGRGEDDEYELVPAKPKLKGRPRAWVVPD